VDPGITVVIPTIERRRSMLNQALASVRRQTLPATAVVVEVDTQREGAWVTRNKGMLKVQTEWTAFLDDDDMFLPHHLEFLHDRATAEDLDLCWGWYVVLGGTDPFPGNRGVNWSGDSKDVFPITVLCRTAFLHRAHTEMGGFQVDSVGKTRGSWQLQDFPVWDNVVNKHHAKHRAFKDITWQWRHHENNTSGLPGLG
jgi:glycosyltransferase involved in cell wall biosynthesis